ncbi:MAG: hypothetical protein ACYTXF_36745 [Nostoc sp.]
MSSLEIPLVWGKKAIAEFGRRSDRLLLYVQTTLWFTATLSNCFGVASHF